MTISRKPWISVSSARTAGRCHPAWWRKTPCLYPAIISIGGFISGFGIISSFPLKKSAGHTDSKSTACSLYTLVQSINCSATLLQFVSITAQSSNKVPHFLNRDSGYFLTHKAAHNGSQAGTRGIGRITIPGYCGPRPWLRKQFIPTHVRLMCERRATCDSRL